MIHNTIYLANSVCFVPGTVLSILKTLAHLILIMPTRKITILVYFHFIEEVTEAKSYLAKVTLSVSIQSGKENHFGYFRGNIITSIVEGILIERLEEQKEGRYNPKGTASRASILALKEQKRK